MNTSRKDLKQQLLSAQELLAEIENGSDNRDAGDLDSIRQLAEKLDAFNGRLDHALIEVIASLKKRLADFENQQHAIKASAFREKILIRMLHLGLEKLPLEKYLQQSLEMLTSLIPWLGARPEAAVFLSETETETGKSQLRLAAFTDNFSATDRALCALVPFGACLCGAAAEQNIVVFAASDDERHQYRHSYEQKHRHYCIPIRNLDENIGVLLMHLSPDHVPGEEEVVFLERVADAMSLTIQNTRSQNELLVAKREAENANMAKNDFLARISHELRTPMNAILGFGQLLQMDDENLNEDQKEGISHIMEGGQHLLHLINEVLDITQLDSQRLQMKIEPVSAMDAVDKALMFIKPMAAKHDITIDKDNNVQNACLLADWNRLKQVLVNLMSNAVKYNQVGGKVHITCEVVESRDEPDEKRVRIAVNDTGTGIQQDDYHKIFEPFTRACSDDIRIEGTGIGLAISRKLVQLMNGEIGFSSQYGVGSSFWIELPWTDVRPDSTDADTRMIFPVNDTRKQCKLLYIEDNPANFMLMKNIVDRLENYDLVSATTGESGIMIARDQTPDLILLDINLPGIDGIEVLKKLKTHDGTASIPVLAVSAEAMQDQVEIALQNGFDGYIAKPFDVEDLLYRIEQLLQP